MNNTSLTADQAVTMQEVETEALDILQNIVSILEAVEAYSAVSRISDNRSSTHSYPSDQAVNAFLDDGYRMRKTVETVDCMEFAGRELAAVFERRKMSMAPHTDLTRRAGLVSLRLYRTLWDMAMPADDKAAMDSLLSVVDVPSHMRFWEDIPSPWAGRSYAQLRSPMTGLAVFSHCCGFTFVEYNKGKAQLRGWSVPLDTMEEAVKLYRNNETSEALKLIC